LSGSNSPYTAEKTSHFTTASVIQGP
jgi:hypothetical protein